MLRTASLWPPRRKWLATVPVGAEYRAITKWNRCDIEEPLPAGGGGEMGMRRPACAVVSQGDIQSVTVC